MRYYIQMVIAIFLIYFSFGWIIKPGYYLIKGHNRSSNEWNLKKGRYLKSEGRVVNVKILRNEYFEMQMAEPMRHDVDYELSYIFFARDGKQFTGKCNESESSEGEFLVPKENASDWKPLVIYYDSIDPVDNYPENLFKILTSEESQNFSSGVRWVIFLFGILVSVASLLWLYFSFRAVVKNRSVY